MIIKNGLLEEFYKQMLQIRFCEEGFIEPILNGEIKCPVHLYSGEEAIATGVCSALRKDDYIFGNHRSHGHYIAKGGDIKKMVAEIFGKESGCSRGRGGSMHLIDPLNNMLGSAPIVGGTISLTVGAALASILRGDKRVAVSFFGDGATGEGVLYESLNFASLKKLPVIFVCENNLYSTHMPIREMRLKNDIYKIGKAFNIDTYRVDGNDVIKVYEHARSAVDKCREGGGPIFLEFLTYRQRGHVGPDDNIQGSHTDIRPRSEIQKWLKKDPIIIFEKYLKENNVYNNDDLELIKSEIKSEIEDIFNEVKSHENPKRGELEYYVYK